MRLMLILWYIVSYLYELAVIHNILQLQDGGLYYCSTILEGLQFNNTILTKIANFLIVYNQRISARYVCYLSGIERFAD